jgi:hypothetical protein
MLAMTLESRDHEIIVWLNILANLSDPGSFEVPSRPPASSLESELRGERLFCTSIHLNISGIGSGAAPIEAAIRSERLADTKSAHSLDRSSK